MKDFCFKIFGDKMAMFEVAYCRPLCGFYFNLVAVLKDLLVTLNRFCELEQLANSFIVCCIYSFCKRFYNIM